MRYAMVSRAMLLASVVLLVSPYGCGPGSSGEPGTPTTTASVSGEDPRGVAPAPSPATVANSPSPSIPAPLPERQLVVPDWMASALQHQDVHVRLKALDTWVKQGRRGAVDPLLLALNDTDERVRARALQLIEQDWMAEQAAQLKQSP